MRTPTEAAARDIAHADALSVISAMTDEQRWHLLACLIQASPYTALTFARRVRDGEV